MPTYTEADRDQFGGDYTAIRSAIDKFGVQRPYSRALAERPGILDIFPGDYIFKPDPTKKVAMKWIELNDTDHAMSDYITSVGDGWKFCESKEWDVREALRYYVKPNTSKHLSIDGKDSKTLALMWTDIENYDHLVARERVFSDEVQYALQRQVASSQDNRPKDGGPYEVIGTEVKVEDDVEARR